MRVDPDLWPLTTRVDVEGRLCVGGVALNEIADQYGTPAYILDEADFRYRIRHYRAALPGVRITYAGKALLTKQVARWVADEGLGLDVCSPGELATAWQPAWIPATSSCTATPRPPVNSGRPPTQVLAASSSTAAPRSPCWPASCRHPQEVLIRVAPGIDIHGHAAVTTGIVDQKFGFASPKGRPPSPCAACSISGCSGWPACTATSARRSRPRPVWRGDQRMVSLMATSANQYGVVSTELNIGGGHGVPYVTVTPSSTREAGKGHRRRTRPACANQRFPRPKVVVEPGRAIAARAGVTCYRVVSVKHRPGGRSSSPWTAAWATTRGALYGATLHR